LDAGENCTMKNFFAKYHQDMQLNDELGSACGIDDETIMLARFWLENMKETVNSYGLDIDRLLWLRIWASGEFL
jgi:hypothetical protein